MTAPIQISLSNKGCLLELVTGSKVQLGSAHQHQRPLSGSSWWLRWACPVPALSIHPAVSYFSLIGQAWVTCLSLGQSLELKRWNVLTGSTWVTCSSLCSNCT